MAQDEARDKACERYCVWVATSGYDPNTEADFREGWEAAKRHFLAEVRAPTPVQPEPQEPLPSINIGQSIFKGLGF